MWTRLPLMPITFVRDLHFVFIFATTNNKKNEKNIVNIERYTLTNIHTDFVF